MGRVKRRFRAVMFLGMCVFCCLVLVCFMLGIYVDIYIYMYVYLYVICNSEGKASLLPNLPAVANECLLVRTLNVLVSFVF